MTTISPIENLQRDPVRDRLHDLRNLFGAVASGTHLLADPIAPARRDIVLDAMDQAAARGAEILSAMLADPGADAITVCRFPERVAGLEPILLMTAGDEIRLELDIGTRSAWVRCVPEQLDRVVLELVTNAHRALAGHGRIVVRVRCAGERIWLIVADTGTGMTKSCVAHALGELPARREAEHGTGMGPVRAFAQDVGGALHIRSRPGKGTVVAIVLPLTPAELLSLR